MPDTKKIEDQIIELDGQSFVGFEITRCMLIYRGGTPPMLRDSTFDSCEFRLEGAAKNTADFIGGIAGSGPEAFALALSMIGIQAAPGPEQGIQSE